MSNSQSRKELIKDIQNNQLILLSKFDEICKRHDIEYFLYWGSLIGAIRHNGFIPWDDDLDIGMLRRDYEKLCLVNDFEWGEFCEFVKPTEGSSIHDKIFARIYVRDSKIQSPRDIYHWKMRDSGKAFYTKLMCDIYVFDYIPNNTLVYEFKQSYLSQLSKLYKLTKCYALPEKNGCKSILKAASKNLLGNALCFFHKKPYKYLAQKYERVAKMNEITSRIGCYCEGGDSTVGDINDFFPLKEVAFDNLIVPVPKEYDKLLRAYYGNYMELPKEEDRFHISFNYLEIGNRRHVIENIKNSLSDIYL